MSDAVAEYEFPTAERIPELFLYSLTVLPVGDDGLGPTDLADLEAIAFLARAVKCITIVPNTVADTLLFRLACVSEELLTTAAVDLPDNAEIVDRWVKARAELLKCQLGGL